jgi:hypothetical protein
MVAEAYTKEDADAVLKEISGLSRSAREYVEHILGNGLMRIQQASTINPGKVGEEVDRIVKELTTAGFWELRRLRGI